jgi:hypothetical protein
MATAQELLEKGHRDAEQINQALARAGQQREAQNGQAAQIIRFAAQHGLSEYTVWAAKDRAFHEAAGDLQEAQHRLKAAELGEEDDEVRAIVGVRRAERRHAEAQQAAQAAWEAMAPIVATRLHQLMTIRCRAWNVRAREYQVAYEEGLKRLNEQAAAHDAELQRLRQAEIVPLMAFGAPEPRTVLATKLYAID